ncbi:MAG: histidinol-phosphate transaminase [Microthrixaceae bacterium]
MARPQPRPSLDLVAGYHSAQVDVSVRLNTNESPEPPPAGFVEALKLALDQVQWNRYPDRSALQLRARIAQVESKQPFEDTQSEGDSSNSLTAKNVCVANGSNEILQSLCLAYGGPSRSVLTFEPSYALHEHIARVCGTEVIQLNRDSEFQLDLDEAVATIQASRPSITFLCSPNNPTAMVENAETVGVLLQAVESVDGLLVVDEAYGQFAAWTALNLVAEDRSLVVTRTYSKTWSAAALRLGYLIGPTWVIDQLEKVLLPYHLDAVTQAAGLLALDYQAEMEQRVETLVRERERVVQAFKDLPLQQWPSEANFILFRPHRSDTNPSEGDRVWQELVNRSVLVRNCSSWARLDGCLRVTLGTAEENDKFLAALSEVLR